MVLGIWWCSIKKVSCYYYFISPFFFASHISCLFIFLSTLGALWFGAKSSSSIGDFSWTSSHWWTLVCLAWVVSALWIRGLWEHPGSRTTRDTRMVILNPWPRQMAPFWPPAWLRQGSFPRFCSLPPAVDLIAPFSGRTSLFLTNGEVLFSFLNRAMLVMVFQHYFLSFLYAWGRKVSASAQAWSVLIVNHHYV